ncbi:MAG: hypothetical protein NTX22_17015 [Ignavibacteriales bacterium]|nr:hypothetical protein [Ignavibacteriales bacterium]
METMKELPSKLDFVDSIEIKLSILEVTIEGVMSVINQSGAKDSKIASGVWFAYKEFKETLEQYLTNYNN